MARNIDLRGFTRSNCTNCETCEMYERPDGGNDCDYCGCKPVAHVHVKSSAKKRPIEEDDKPAFHVKKAKSERMDQAKASESKPHLKTYAVLLKSPDHHVTHDMSKTKINSTREWIEDGNFNLCMHKVQAENATEAAKIAHREHNTVVYARYGKNPEYDTLKHELCTHSSKSAHAFMKRVLKDTIESDAKFRVYERYPHIARDQGKYYRGIGLFVNQ